MRRRVLVLLVAAIALVPMVGSYRSLAQGVTPGVPQGDEFNSNDFSYPFAPQCGALATGTCPDPQGPTTWSLNNVRPGFLRIMTQFGSLVGSGAQSSNNARNLVLQPVNPSADYVVTTDLTFPGGNFSTITPLGQTAGLLVYQDDDHFIYLGREFSNNQTQIVFVQENGPDTLVRNSVTETGILRPEVFLRITKTGTLYQASYSYDNVTFTPVSPGLAPTPVPSATPTSTATTTATATATPSVTNTPTATNTPAPTATSTPLPTGYTAAYTAPKLGVFAWGGTNAAVVNAILAADFDWFRVGTNSQTPAPSPTATMTNTAGPTSTATETATSTAVSTATETPTATATQTAVPTDTPVPTSTPRPPKPRFGFSYVSVWYHYVRIGTRQHLEIQAKARARHGIWTTVHFATGKTIRYFEETNNRGFWSTDFIVPGGTISRHSAQAVVTFQLWRGKRTTKSFSSFVVIR